MIVPILLLETLLAPIVCLGVLFSFLLSGKRGRLSSLASELPERFGLIPAAELERLKGRDIAWFHAASTGEVSGLVPILEALSEKKKFTILLTTTTRSGRDAARALSCVDWAQLAPLDAWPCVARFLGALSPRRLILAETELWPTMMILASRAGLRPVLVNARLSAERFTRYRLLALFLAPVLRKLSFVGAQSEEDAARFAALGVPRERIKVTGNTKYDRVNNRPESASARAKVAALGWERFPLFVAGSTHPYEEEMVIASFLAARRAVRSLRLVLAPRHLERARDAAELILHSKLTLARWSEEATEDCDVLLLDKMGVLASFYALARVAFVGGTFVKVGGHNLLEPASSGVPVLFGPYTDNIERPAELLAAPGGGGRRVRDAGELAERLVEFARDENAAHVAGRSARAVADSLRGASTRTLAVLGMGNS